MGNKWAVIDPLQSLGVLALDQGDTAAARKYAQEMLKSAQEGEFKLGLGKAFSQMGHIAYIQNDFNLMETNFLETLAIARELGFKKFTIWVLRLLGIAAKRQDENQRAAAYLLESLPLAQSIEDWHGIVMTLGLMAGIAAGTGQPDRAARLLGAEEKQLESLNMILDYLEQVEFDRDIALLRSQLDEVAFKEAWSDGRSMTLEQAVAETFAIGSELNS
jgi:hypothetical protein